MICDTCGKVIVPNVQARYTVADSDDGQTGRHYDCHSVRVDKLAADLKRMPELSSKTLDSIERLRNILGGRNKRTR